MKKIILAAIMSLAFLGTQVQTAKANGWPIAAGVVGGLAVGTAIGVAASHPVYYAPAPAYYPPPAYYAPAPAPVYAQPPPTVVYAQPGYVAAPVVTLGFGFGRPYWGDYRGYWGHPSYHWHR